MNDIILQFDSHSSNKERKKKINSKFEFGIGMNDVYDL